MSSVDTIQRAFELAADGHHRSVGDIKKTLTRERFSGVDEHLSGPSLQKQLRQLILRSATGDDI